MTAKSACLCAASLFLLTAFSLSATNAAPPAKELQQQLIHAVIQNQTDVVQSLLARGGDPNARVEPGKEDAWVLEHQASADPTPPLLVLACRFGCPNSIVIQQLIQKGANVNLTDKNDVTPLMAASELDWDPSIALLLKNGAKVNAKDKSGRTALMYATGNRGLGACAKLLEKGAEINARDNMGRTPLMNAITQAAYDPIWLYGEDMVKKEKIAKERYLELITFLLAQGASVNVRDKAGNTPLLLARAQKQSEVIQRLLQAARETKI